MPKLINRIAREIVRRGDAFSANVHASNCEKALERRRAAFEAMGRARVMAERAEAGAAPLRAKAHAAHMRFGTELAAAIAASTDAPQFTFTGDDPEFVALLTVANRAATATAHALTLLTEAFETADAEYRAALAKSNKAKARLS